jgi:protein-disulfide isomerase
MRAATFTRRAVIAAGIAVVGSAAIPPVSAQRITDAIATEILKPGALPDLVIGSADARVTVVEYASMTCGHCAAFHAKIFPELKAKYIDTGKIRFVFREFPLDNLAAAASLLARCAGPDRTLDVVSRLFASQQTWVVEQGAVLKLFDIAKDLGFTQAGFDKCLNDQALLDKLIAGRERAEEAFKVDSTPTFFIDGRKLDGGTLADFDKALAPLLKG